MDANTSPAAAKHPDPLSPGEVATYLDIARESAGSLADLLHHLEGLLRLRGPRAIAGDVAAAHDGAAQLRLGLDTLLRSVRGEG